MDTSEVKYLAVVGLLILVVGMAGGFGTGVFWLGLGLLAVGVIAWGAEVTRKDQAHRKASR